MTEEQRRRLKIKRRRKRKLQRFLRKCAAAVVGMGVFTAVVAAVFFYLIGTSEDRPGITEATRAPSVTMVPVPAPTEMPVPALTATPRPTLQIDPNAGALITPTPAPTEPGVAIAGWSKIEIPAGALEANVAINNPEDNAGWYYLTYELRLKGTNEGIFTTGLIPPGMYCNKVTLTRPMEAGIYSAILHVQPYRMDAEQSPTNNADLELLLVVK